LIHLFIAYHPLTDYKILEGIDYLLFIIAFPVPRIMPGI
jgi:hypothetical protein